jgi:hypothetical protein
MKTRRYILPARPERTVILVPLTGSRTLLSEVLRIVRNERIPRDAKVRILTNRNTGARSLRYEFTE